MKIIQITPFFIPIKKQKITDKKKFEFFGGAETLVFSLSRALLKKGHDVTIYTLNYDSNKFEQYEHIGIKVKYFPKMQFWKAAFSFQLLLSIIKENEAVFHGVHVGHPLTLFSALICLIFGKKFFCTHTGTRKFLPFSIMTSKIASRIIIPTEFQIDFFKSFSSATNTVIIPHGIDLETFNPRNADKIIRDRIVEKNDFIILFVGRLRWHKGVEYLIRSFYLAKKELKNAHLVIVGDGEERKRLESLVNLKKLENKIHFLGYVESDLLPKIYAESDIFVLPSITSDNRGNQYIETEAFGIVLIEAMASGSPVIASKVGGVPYVVEHGKNGFLFEEKNIKDLAEKITYLYKSNEERMQMSRNCIKITKNKYSWEIISDKYIKLFKLEH